MKRRISALAAAILMLAACSCKKNEPTPQTPSTTTTTATTTTTIPLPELPENPKAEDILEKRAKNPDAFGWIEVEGTEIDYPILQSGPDTEEDFYLNHNDEGTEADEGAIYIQKQNGTDFRDPNTIVYGHNMGDGTMFRHIHRFREKDFFEQNDTVTVYIPGHILTYRIYAVIGYSENHVLADYNFYTEEGRQGFIDAIQNSKSRIKHIREEAAPTIADRLVTLSTCTNRSDADERLLLIAVLEQDTLTK